MKIAAVHGASHFLIICKNKKHLKSRFPCDMTRGAHARRGPGRIKAKSVFFELFLNLFSTNYDTEEAKIKMGAMAAESIKPKGNGEIFFFFSKKILQIIAQQTADCRAFCFSLSARLMCKKAVLFFCERDFVLHSPAESRATFGCKTGGQNQESNPTAPPPR